MKVQNKKRPRRMAHSPARRYNSAKSEEKEEFVVKVSIIKADDIDGENMGSNGQLRLYQVFGSFGPGKEFNTQKAEGFPDPVWKWSRSFDLDQLSGIDLELDVVRIGSKSDPGTSTGTVLIGRAGIALPDIYNKSITYTVGLVRHDGARLVAEGHITLSMKIERFKNTNGDTWEKY